MLINRVGMSHRAPTDTAIEPGDLLILDTALETEGYYSDIARTIYFLKDGEHEPPEREQRVFQAIYGAIDAAFAALKPGFLVIRSTPLPGNTCWIGAIRKSSIPPVTRSGGTSTTAAPFSDRCGTASAGHPDCRPTRAWSLPSNPPS